MVSYFFVVLFLSASFNRLMFIYSKQINSKQFAKATKLLKNISYR